MEHNERRAKPRLPRESRATVTTWQDFTGDIVTKHYGITDGTYTVEFETLHAARMAAFIHNSQNGN